MTKGEAIRIAREYLAKDATMPAEVWAAFGKILSELKAADRFLKP